MTENTFDIFFLVESGIGNAIQILYAVEYCLHNNKKTGVFLNKMPVSFVDYVRACYGNNVVVNNIDNIKTTNLVHSFTFEEEHKIKFDEYFYVKADSHSSKYMSETEQYLSVAKALYPSGYSSYQLRGLKEDHSPKVQQVRPDEKYVLYPGCSSANPSKRWPYFQQFINKVGEQNVIVLGGSDDLNYTHSYYYPKWVCNMFTMPLLRRNFFFNLMKSFNLLKKHAHFDGLEKQDYAYFNIFSWPELVAILRRARQFIGNDGGITHLAGACDAQGFVVFGPTSVNKNKTYNPKLVPLSTQLGCQPCQFRVNHRDIMGRNAILCSHQLQCLYTINVNDIPEAKP